MVRPTILGIIMKPLDQVLITPFYWIRGFIDFVKQLVKYVWAFFWWIFYDDYFAFLDFLLLMINLLDGLLGFLVFWPFAMIPVLETGCPPDALPSPPPSGDLRVHGNTFFTLGLTPNHLFLPAPSSSCPWSGLETTPIVALHVNNTLLTPEDGILITAYFAPLCR